MHELNRRFSKSKYFFSPPQDEKGQVVQTARPPQQLCGEGIRTESLCVTLAASTTNFTM